LTSSAPALEVFFSLSTSHTFRTVENEALYASEIHFVLLQANHFIPCMSQAQYLSRPEGCLAKMIAAHKEWDFNLRLLLYMRPVKYYCWRAQ